MHRFPGRVIILTLSIYAAACDAEPPTSAQPSTATTSAPRSIVETSTVALLLPGRATHIAVEPSGKVYWTQEADGANEIVFALTGDAVPRATDLSTTGVLAALDAPPGASGTIQSIAAGADGRIYFYFSGGAKAVTLAALGRFDPQSSELRILADTRALRAASRMGADLGLARGTLIPSREGKQIWFWLRHSDRSLLFRFDAETAPTPPDQPFPLGQPFDRVTIRSASTRPADPVELSLTDERQSLGAGGEDGSLLLLDIPASMLRRIDAGTGVATDLASLTDFPQSLSQPAADLRPGAPPGRVLLFAADAERLPARSAEQAAEIPIVGNVNYPALLVLDPPRIGSVLDWTKIRAHARFPMQTLALQQLLYAGNDDWIAYDAGSGELLRLQMPPAR